MTDDRDRGPGQTIAPALPVTPTRNFDGGLLSRYSYVLTQADALAYLRLRREWSGRAKIMLALWFFAGGALFGLLPEAMKGPPDSWRSIAAFLGIMALQFALLLIALTLWQHHRARRMVPRPRPGVFEEWIDGIAASQIDDTEDAFLSPELIGQVLNTASHIFVLNHNTTMVIPTRAFANAAEAAEMADHIRELARGPYYFDA